MHTAHTNWKPSFFDRRAISNLTIIALLAIATGIASGCESESTSGPSDELIQRELSSETLSETNQIFDVKSHVLSRRLIADDLIEIDLELTMFRTFTEVPPQIRARAALKKRIEGDSSMFDALQLPAGAELPTEKHSFYYKRGEHGWVREK